MFPITGKLFRDLRMSRITIDMSPSLDGYIAGPGVTNEQALGHSGHLLHRWIGLGGARQAAADRQAAGDMFATAGAVVIGRRMFDVGIDKWGEDGAFERPCFVVTRRPRAVLTKGPTVFTFVTSVPEAIRLARAAAGSRDVVVAGGAEIAQQCLAARIVDEIRLHVVPVLLGGGTLLFSPTSQLQELELTSVTPSPNATHVTYKVVR
jgi:dihydrofolate reductase